MKPKDQYLYLQEIPLFKISMIRETTYQLKNVTGPQTVVEAMKPLFEGADREIFAVLMLDTKNNILGMNIVHIGTLNCSLVGVREVFKPAVIAGAASIIIAHNHPSGDVTPSEEDFEVNKRVKAGGELLDILLLDSLIFGYNCAKSTMHNDTVFF